MADRLIIFSAPMVRALLDGRKTQTRRIIPDGAVYEDISSEAAEDFELRGWDIFSRGEALCAAQVRWDVSDRLWVRERGWVSKSKTAFQPFVGNEADPGPHSPDGTPYKACPSIHMPRWASRLTLAVTDVRVERLQDISEADCDAEAFGGDFPHAVMPELFSEADGRLTIKECFQRLWNSISGPDAWANNPWVAVIGFTVHRANIDALDLGASS